MNHRRKHGGVCWHIHCHPDRELEYAVGRPAGKAVAMEKQRHVTYLTGYGGIRSSRCSR